jgi:hypothetical protein
MCRRRVGSVPEGTRQRVSTHFTRTAFGANDSDPGWPRAVHELYGLEGGSQHVRDLATAAMTVLDWRKSAGRLRSMQLTSAP